MDWAATTIRAFARITIPTSANNAEVANTYELDVERFTSDFEINGIPSAAMSVAVGTRADDIRIASNIHKIISSLKFQIPISVYLSMASSPSPQMEVGEHIKSRAWPSGYFRCYRGYAIGSSFRTAASEIEFTLHMTHWLADLAFSSSASRVSHPSNPSQVSFNAAFPDFISTNAGIAHSTPQTMARSFLLPNTIQDDFWGGVGSSDITNASQLQAAGDLAYKFGIKGWLRSLASVDRIASTTTFRNIFPGLSLTSNTNWEALRALQHFEPHAKYILGDGTEVQEYGYTDGVPLSLDSLGEINSANILSRSISEAIGNETFRLAAGYTLWDKLVGHYSPNFLFVVVPTVEKALIVPYTPGLKWKNTPGAIEITTQDYDHLELNTTMPVPLRGVVLMSAMGSVTGHINNGSRPTTSFFHSYISQDRQRQGGQLMFKELPGWLNNPLASLYNSNSLQGSTAQFPNGSGVGLGAAGSLSSDKVDSTLRPFTVAYAKAMYVQEVTKGRKAVLAGRLRYDISPGTLVKVQVEDGRRLNPVSIAATTHIYGVVQRVTCSFDAEANTAGTAIQIGFITDQDEQNAGDLCIDTHPIWTKNFYGASLAVSGGNDVVLTDPLRHRWQRTMPPSVTSG